MAVQSYLTADTEFGPGPSTLLTLLRSRLLLLLRLLDEQVKHLRLEEPLDKVSRGPGVNGLVETFLVEHPPFSSMAALHVRGVMADCFHKELQEGFRHHPVQRLHR